MINALEIINHNGEMLRCLLENPESSGFSIDKIDGLGPGKINLNSKELPGMDGGLVTNARMPPRNIVLYCTLYDWFGNRYQTIEQSRNRLYDLFSIKTTVTLIIETDLHRYKISGIVESNEPDIFSPEESMQVSIICPMPYFVLDDPNSGESGEIEQSIFTTVGLFEFPWTNPIYSREIEFGVSASNDDRWSTLQYSGDVDVGVIFKLKVLSIGSPNYIWIQYYGNSEQNNEVTWIRFSNIAFNWGLQADDELIISTVPRNKYAIIKRGTETINALRYVKLGGEWIKFHKGPNVLRLVLTDIAGDTPTELSATVEYQELYAGV